MIQALAWDSQHFGLRIGRIEGDALSEASVRAFADERERFDCVYLLADASDAETSERAHQLGFRVVDLRVTLSRTLGDAPAAPGGDHAIREAAASDLPPLDALAAASYGTSRFYFDRGFERTRVDGMYRIWIRNECNNARAKVFVVDSDTGPAGFTTCTVSGAEARIGLVAVAASQRGTGSATALLAHTLRWAAARGAAQITVVTQARNVAALRLYERAGFRCQRVEVWYHAWRA